MFLHPVISVITNIDADHLSSYDDSFDQLKATFLEFVHHLPFYGLAVVCIDDEHIEGMLAAVERPVTTYGFSAQADVRAVKLRQQGSQMRFNVQFKTGESIEDVQLNLPGKHNVLNALASIAVARELKVDDAAVKKALSDFAGISRRMQSHGQIEFPAGSALLFDDYGHHPTEISATLAALRGGWPDKRLVVVFQPHRYTRTRDLFEEFAEALTAADVLLIAEVYSAGEEPILGADARSLCSAIRDRSNVDPIFISDLSAVPTVLEELLHDEDVVLTLGAGNVGSLCQSLPALSKEAVNAGS